MNKAFKTATIIAAIALFITACGAQVARAQPEEQALAKAITYESVLGRSLKDRRVASFIANNNCNPSGPFQLCPSAGFALWADKDHVIKSAYVYISNTKGFEPYKGGLPFDLESNDTMMNVEEKLGQPGIAFPLEAGSGPGEPNEWEIHDILQYWAVYKQLGVTIVYNTAFAEDKGATIHAIIVSK